MPRSELLFESLSLSFQPSFFDSISEKQKGRAGICGFCCVCVCAVCFCAWKLWFCRYSWVTQRVLLLPQGALAVLRPSQQLLLWWLCQETCAGVKESHGNMGWGRDVLGIQLELWDKGVWSAGCKRREVGRRGGLR